MDKQMIHIDSFSGAVADLSKKEQGYPLKVLRALRKGSLVSTWDMSESTTLRASLRYLVNNEMIEELDEAYPWYRFQLTNKGKEAEAKDER